MNQLLPIILLLKVSETACVPKLLPKMDIISFFIFCPFFLRCKIVSQCCFEFLFPPFFVRLKGQYMGWIAFSMNCKFVFFASHEQRQQTFVWGVASYVVRLAHYGLWSERRSGSGVSGSGRSRSFEFLVGQIKNLAFTLGRSSIAGVEAYTAARANFNRACFWKGTLFSNLIIAHSFCLSCGALRPPSHSS